MKTLTLLALLALCFTATSAFGKPKAAKRKPASAGCGQNIQAAIDQIESAESSSSVGQIEACLPSKDPAVNSREIGAKLAGAKRLLEHGEAGLTALAPALSKLSGLQVRDVGGYHICDESGAVKQEIQATHASLQATDHELREGVHDLAVARSAFEKNYSGRWRKLESYMPPRVQANCKDTQRNVKAVLAALKAADAACDAKAIQSREAYERSYRLQAPIADGCVKKFRRCEAVPYAGDREGYHYGIDIIDAYGTIEHSDEKIVGSLEERNDLLMHIRDCCERVDDAKGERDPDNCRR